jgi:hypothetical protein
MDWLLNWGMLQSYLTDRYVVVDIAATWNQ